MTTTGADIRRTSPESTSFAGVPDYSSSRWYCDWGNLVLIGLALVVGVYLLWSAFEWGGERTVTLVQEVAFVPVMLTGVVFAWRTARMFRTDRRARTAWILLGAAFLIWLVGDASWAYYLIIDESFPFVSLVSASYLASLALILAGALMFPTLGIAVEDRRVFRLDTSIIMIGILSMAAFFVIGPDRLRYSDGTVEALGLFVYVVGTTSALLIAYRTLALRPANGGSLAILLLVTGLTIIAVANLAWTYFEVRGVTIAGGSIYAVWMVGHAILVASPQMHYDAVRRRRTSAVIDSLVCRSHALIPYVATAVGTVVLMTTGIHILIDRMGIVILLVMSLISLIVARQLVSLRQNAQLQAARAVRDTENWFRTLVMYSSDMITVIDRDARCCYQSPSATDVARYLPESPVGSRFLDWVHANDQQNVQEALEHVLDERNDSAIVKVEWRLDTGDDAPIQFETIISNWLNDPTVNGLVLNSRDVTERKQLEDRLTYQAFHDPLTSLPNRAMFFTKLDQAMKRAEPECGVALLFVDVDDFKLINDRFGHETGDRFLQEVGLRLQASLRPGDVLSRLAGDEFTILLRNLGSPDDAFAVAERVLQHLEEPVQVDEVAAPISTSIGIAFTTDAEIDSADLLHQADIAMYAAKNSGSGCVALYKPGLEQELTKAGRMSRSRADD